jgi:DNA-binding response OmpR family regulator
MRILLVEDESGIAQFIIQGLMETGHTIELVKDGKQARNYLSSLDYDVIILDIMLPQIDGFTLLRELRNQNNTTPVLILTAKDAIEDRVQGLDNGADDYLTKPFAFSELLARLRALQRRPPLQSSPILAVADLTLDPIKREVKKSDNIIELSPLEFRLLEYLLRNHDRVLTRTQIGEYIWGLDFYNNSNVVDVYVGYLRRKIDKGAEFTLIQTIRGIGYCLRKSN